MKELLTTLEQLQNGELESEGSDVFSSSGTVSRHINSKSAQEDELKKTLMDEGEAAVEDELNQSMNNAGAGQVAGASTVASGATAATEQSSSEQSQSSTSSNATSNKSSSSSSSSAGNTIASAAKGATNAMAIAVPVAAASVIATDKGVREAVASTVENTVQAAKENAAKENSDEESDENTSEASNEEAANDEDLEEGATEENIEDEIGTIEPKGSGSSSVVAAKNSGDVNISMSKEGSNNIEEGDTIEVKHYSTPKSVINDFTVEAYRPIAASVDTLIEENVNGELGIKLSLFDSRFSHKVSDQRFEVTDEGIIILKENINFENEPTIDLVVENSRGDKWNVTVSILDANDNHTSMALASNPLEENTHGPVLVEIQINDEDTSNTYTHTVDDSRFEVVDNSIRLKEGSSINYEEEPSVSLTITTTDDAGLVSTSSVTLNVVDKNDTHILSAISIDTDENSAGVTVGTFEVSDEDTSNTYTHTVDDSRFEVVNDTIRLKAGSSINYEEETSIDLVVTTVDNEGLSTSASVTITVIDKNDQHSTFITSSSLEENKDNYKVGEIAVQDEDLTNTYFHTVDDSRFEVVGSDIRIKEGAFINYEEEPAVTLSVTTVDGAGLEFVSEAIITITDSDDPLKISLSDITSIKENTTGIPLFSVIVEDEDATISSYQLQIDSNRFEIINNSIQVRDGIIINFELEEQVSLTVAVLDGNSSIIFAETVVLTVDDVNERPTDITTSDIDPIKEGRASVQVFVTDLSVDDLSPTDTHTFTSLSDRFEVVGAKLYVKAGAYFDYETETNATATIRVVDSEGNAFTKDIQVPLTDVLDIDVKYFNTNGTHHFDFDTTTPVHEANVATLTLNSTGGSIWEDGPSDSVGLVATTKIYVDVTGNYTFYTSGDDGHKLYIDGEVIIDKDNGSQSDDQGLESIHLTQGYHDLKFEYLEIYYLASYDVRWEGPGFQGIKQITPYSGLPNNAPTDILLDLTRELREGPIDGGSYAIGTLSTVDLEYYNNHTYTISDSRFYIVGNEIRVKKTTEFDYETTQSVSFSITSNDGEGGTFTKDFTLSIKDVPEIQATYIHALFDKVKNVTWNKTPEYVGEIDDLYQPATDNGLWTGGRVNNIGMDVSFNLDVTETGTYTFYVVSDTSSVLSLDGSILVDADDGDGINYITYTNSIYLEEGSHALRYQFVENLGDLQFKVEWEGPGTYGREVIGMDDVYAP